MSCGMDAFCARNDFSPSVLVEARDSYRAIASKGTEELVRASKKVPLCNVALMSAVGIQESHRALRTRLDPRIW